MAGTARESRLAIIIDTRDSEAKIRRLREQLRELGVVTDELGRRTRQASDDTDRLSRSASRSRGSISAMTKAVNLLGAAFGGISAAAILKTADAMQNLNNKIRVATDGAGEYALAQQEIERIAMGTYSALESVGELYASNERALGAMGKTQQEVLGFTENITKAMSVSGGTAQAQAAALTQLGQAMASGALRGDEFNSIAEQAPVLLELLSDKLNMTTGELRAFAAEGGITSGIVYDAISGATEKLDGMMGQTVVTMAQAFENVKTQWSLFADDFVNGSNGVSAAIVSMLTVVSTNFDEVVNIVKAAAIVFAVQFVSGITLAATATGGLAGAFKALTAVMLANPLTAMVAIVLAVSAATGELGNTLKTVGIIAGDLFNFIKTGYAGLYELVNAVVYNIAADTADATNQSSGFFATFFSNTAGGFAGLLQGIARIIAAAVGVLGGFFSWLGKAVATAGKGIANAFIWGFNKASEAAADAVNGIANLIRKGLGGLNTMINGANDILAMTPLSIRVKTIDVGTGDVVTAKKIAMLSNSYTSLGDSVGEYVGIAVGGVDSYFDTVSNRMSEVSEQKATLDSLSESFTTVGDAADKAGKKTKGAGKAAKEAKDKVAKLSEAQKAAEALAKSFASSMAELSKSIAMIGKDTELDKWLYDLNDATNELYGLNDAAKAVLLTQASLFDAKSLVNDVSVNIKDIDNQIALLNAREGIERQLLSIQQEMNTELAKYNVMKQAGLLDDYATVEQALKLNAAKKEQLVMAQARIASQSAVDGVMSEINPLSPADQIEADYKRRLDIIAENELLITGIIGSSEAERLAIKQNYEKAKQDLELKKQSQTVGSIAAMFGMALGETSKGYQAMFAVQKAYDFVMAQSSSFTAIAKAWASAPFPANLPAVATTTLSTGIIPAAISALSPQGFKQGGYTGNMGVNQVAGAVHGQEYVFDAASTKRIGVDNLNAMRSGKAANDSEINVNINVVNQSSYPVQATSDGQTITITDVRNEVKRGFTELQNPNSHNAKMVKSSFNTTVRR